MPSIKYALNREPWTTQTRDTNKFFEVIKHQDRNIIDDDATRKRCTSYQFLIGDFELMVDVLRPVKAVTAVL